jgi:hypothetical protein
VEKALISVFETVSQTFDSLLEKAGREIFEKKFFEAT